MREIVSFLKTRKFLKKIKTFENTNEIFRKNLWIVWENIFTQQIIVSYLYINSLSVTCLLMFYLVVYCPHDFENTTL